MSRDETGNEFLVRTVFPKFVALIDRSTCIGTTQLKEVEWWDECDSKSHYIEHAQFWLQKKLFKESSSKK